MAEDRRRSVWAWGWADREPTREDQDRLAKLVEGMLGFPERPRLGPPDLDAVDLAQPRMEPPEIPGAGATTEQRSRMLHTFGKAYRDVVRNLHGVFDPAPDVVARPADEVAIEALLAWAVEENVAVVPFGGGTSVVGGVEYDGAGYAGVLSLDLSRMDAILEVDETDRTARIQAGRFGPAINDGLAEHGYALRHYPQSYEFSTLGGWLATRSGGHYATERTRIDDFCQSLRLVAPTGTLETPHVPDSGAGPDLSRLVLGSEGILGVITEATMQVEPRPEYKAKATVRYGTLEEAVEAARRIVQSGLTPATLRLLDANEAILNQVAMDGSNILLVGFESPEHPVDALLDQALEIAQDAGGQVETPTGSSDDDPDGGQDRWRRSFLEAPYLLNTLATLAIVADTFETACTWRSFPGLHEALTTRIQALMDERAGTGFISMRFTHVYPDGPAPYYTFIAPSQPGEELELWQAIKETASDTLREHGATITHHHAVGRTHRPWYEAETPDELRAALASAKKVLDPAGIMNPGALVDPA